MVIIIIHDYMYLSAFVCMCPCVYVCVCPCVAKSIIIILAIKLVFLLVIIAKKKSCGLMFVPVMII